MHWSYLTCPPLEFKVDQIFSSLDFLIVWSILYMYSRRQKKFRSIALEP